MYSTNELIHVANIYADKHKHAQKNVVTSIPFSAVEWFKEFTKPCVFSWQLFDGTLVVSHPIYPCRVWWSIAMWHSETT